MPGFLRNLTERQEEIQQPGPSCPKPMERWVPRGVTTAGAVWSLLVCTAAYPHQQFKTELVAAFNEPSTLPSLARWFDSPTVSYCDPYPHCISEYHKVQALLNSMANSTR